MGSNGRRSREGEDEGRLFLPPGFLLSDPSAKGPSSYQAAGS